MSVSMAWSQGAVQYAAISFCSDHPWLHGLREAKAGHGFYTSSSVGGSGLSAGGPIAERTVTLGIVAPLSSNSNSNSNSGSNDSSGMVVYVRNEASRAFRPLSAGASAERCTNRIVSEGVTAGG